jgi:Nucleotidyl transferase AbiEii toxin, Type IV TA system
LSNRPPKNLPASIRQKLLDLAHARNDDFGLILVKYGLERILYRLSRSEYRDAFVLKGALLFELWTHETYRATRDADFLARGDNAPERFVGIFQKLAAIEVEPDGLTFVKGHRAYLAHLKSFFRMRKLSATTVEMAKDYSRPPSATACQAQSTTDHQRSDRQPRTGMPEVRFRSCRKAEVHSRESRCCGETLQRTRERPVRRMLTVDEEIRIVESAPPYLRVAIVLLSQTGGRTYGEELSLRWDQVDFDQQLIRLGNNVKTDGSVAPIPSSEFACAVLQAWQKMLGSPESLHLPESEEPRSTHFDGEDSLEGNSQTRRRVALFERLPAPAPSYPIGRFAWFRGSCGASLAAQRRPEPRPSSAYRTHFSRLSYDTYMTLTIVTQSTRNVREGGPHLFALPALT